MTGEDLDRARAEEAWRIYNTSKHGGDLTLIALEAARLARTGWTPPPKADPDLIEAREILANYWRDTDRDHAAEVLNGTWDKSISTEIALAALHRGREIERANPSKDD